MNPSAPPCLLREWGRYENSLRVWLRHRLHDNALVDDLLQEVFIKGMKQGRGFCAIGNARAWLFEVARNTLSDHLRREREMVELPEDLCADEDPLAPVLALADCLPRVLGELSEEDRDAITCCDIQGMAQAEYALHLGIGLAAAKSRVQRARKRLRRQLISACRVRFDEQGGVCCFTPRLPNA